jgi:hypothetical protein
VQCYLPVWDVRFEGLTSVFVEDASNPGCDTVSLGVWFPDVLKEHGAFIFMVKLCSFETSGTTHSVTQIMAWNT